MGCYIRGRTSSALVMSLTLNLNSFATQRGPLGYHDNMKFWIVYEMFYEKDFKGKTKRFHAALDEIQ